MHCRYQPSEKVLQVIQGELYTVLMFIYETYTVEPDKLRRLLQSCSVKCIKGEPEVTACKCRAILLGLMQKSIVC